MKTSTDRILTSHVGSLPRPLDLFDMLTAEDQNQPHDADALEQRVAEAVKDVVAQQVACGVDIVSDGDMGKISYTFYVKHRLSNIDPAAPPGAEIPKENANQDIIEHPEFEARVKKTARWLGPAIWPSLGGWTYRLCE